MGSAIANPRFLESPTARLMMTLKSLLERTHDVDVVRETIGVSAWRLMEMEVGTLTGAGFGQTHPERLE